MLNELFHHECRNYKFFLDKLEVLIEQQNALIRRMEELDIKVELSEEIKKISDILNSEIFKAEKKSINLPENYKDFERAFSHYSLDEKIPTELESLNKHIEYLGNYFWILRGRIKTSQETVFSYILRASEDNIKFSFIKENKIAVRIFILFYQDYFRFQYYRNVIDIENCQLDETFMQNYLAKGEEAEALAFKWFKNEAKKYKI